MSKSNNKKNKAQNKRAATQPIKSTAAHPIPVEAEVQADDAPATQPDRYQTTMLPAETTFIPVSNGYTDGATNGHADSNGHADVASNGYADGNGHADSSGSTNSNRPKIVFEFLEDRNSAVVPISPAAPTLPSSGEDVEQDEQVAGPETIHLRPRVQANGRVGNARVRPAQIERRLDAAYTRLNGNGNGSSNGSRGLNGNRPTAASKRRSRDRRLPVFLLNNRASASNNPRRRTGGNIGARIFIAVLVLGLVFGGIFIGGGVGGFMAYANTLPPVNKFQSLDFETSRIYDRNGVLLAEAWDVGRRTYVPLSQVSPLLISSTIAVEDATFYENSGIEPVALVRAVFINVSGRGSSGASTITQQLVRMIVIPDEKYKQSFDRKLKEAVLAIQLTRAYTKDQILEMYLNEAYYGNLAYGIEAAAQTYFGKHASELALPEAAFLAGMPQLPNYYSNNPDAAKARQKIVLDLSAKAGRISQTQADQAFAAPLNFKIDQQQVAQNAPHFAQYVKEYMENKYGPEWARRGLVITTTLDLRMQQEAETVARSRIDALRELSATNAALVAIKPDTGEIMAMVGSVDYNDEKIDGQVNVATSLRQPGSSIKPVTYAAAFNKGWLPSTSVLDVDTVFGYKAGKPYRPKNYDKEDHGWVTVRTALANSFNIPAVKALQFAGIKETIQLARDMGATGAFPNPPEYYGLSLTLGGGEVTLLNMTNIYATFANMGREVDANPILRITDSRGNLVEELNPQPEGKEALKPEIAYMIADILKDNQARSRMFGENSPLKLSFPASVKTGTTDDNKDSWTLGYTPNLAVGVWVGNSNNARMQAVTGAKGAAFVWHDFMENVYKRAELRELIGYNLPGRQLSNDFVRPTNVIKTEVCTVSKGYIADLAVRGKLPTECKGYKDPPDNKVMGDPGTTNRNSLTPTSKTTPRTGSGTTRTTPRAGSSGGAVRTTPRAGSSARPTPRPSSSGSSGSSDSGGSTSPAPANPIITDPAPAPIITDPAPAPIITDPAPAPIITDPAPANGSTNP